jgi:hypothetical protein
MRPGRSGMERVVLGVKFRRRILTWIVTMSRVSCFGVR